MARGHQKERSQQANAKRQANAKKSGTSLKENQKAAEKALTLKCGVCLSQMPDPKTFKQHFENKHPKAPLPPELQNI